MSDRDLILALRERAVESLRASTKMLKVAQNLLQQGNRKEAARLRNDARFKRNESILLMDQARGLEQKASNILQFRQKHTGELPRDHSLRGHHARTG